MTNTGALVVIGDTLLDRDIQGTVDRVCPDAPAVVLEEAAATHRPGGAALAACLARASDVSVTLITALGGDAGRLARSLLEEAGVQVIDLGMTGSTPEKIRLRSGGQTLMRVDRAVGGGARHVGSFGLEARSAVMTAGAILVSDYGGGMTSLPPVRRALVRAGSAVPVVWDPHPRGADPVAGAALCTPNRSEARTMALDIQGDDLRRTPIEHGIYADCGRRQRSPSRSARGVPWSRLALPPRA